MRIYLFSDMCVIVRGKREHTKHYPNLNLLKKEFKELARPTNSPDPNLIGYTRHVPWMFKHI